MERNYMSLFTIGYKWQLCANSSVFCDPTTSPWAT